MPCLPLWSWPHHHYWKHCYKSRLDVELYPKLHLQLILLKTESKQEEHRPWVCVLAKLLNSRPQFSSLQNGNSSIDFLRVEVRVDRRGWEMSRCTWGASWAPWVVALLNITFPLLRLRDLWEAGGNKNSKEGFVWSQEEGSSNSWK